MGIPAVDSALDVALWFADRARREDMYLPPQKLHRLLYLAQGTYAASYAGRKLMPAVFLAYEVGPMEPNVYRVFDGKRPDLETRPIRPEIDNFLLRVWRKYSHHSPEFLNESVQSHTPYRMALRKGLGQEISFKGMAIYFRDMLRDGGKPKRAAAGPAGTVKTKDGRVLRKWVPTAKPVARAD